MTVQGCDCLIVIKTQYREMGVPYAVETLREAVSLLIEEAPIEGDGSCKAIRKSSGVTGCVVTPLTTGTAPFLLYTDKLTTEVGERFSGDYVTYRINGNEYRNIYGLTLSTKKEGGTKTELWVKRVLSQPPSVAADISDVIKELTVTAQLLREKYEYRHYGMFRVTLKRLVLTADETAVNITDAVIGPLRYYVAGQYKRGSLPLTEGTLNEIL
jgi:hypothetical protein